MDAPEPPFVETIQRLVTQRIAISPPGEGLSLVGGIRYRLLDGSCRASVDIDYHWEGDLETKRNEILDLLQKKLLPEVKRRLHYDGSVSPLEGPGEDGPLVKTATLALFRRDRAASRVEIPIDVTRISCLDPPVVRTVAGTVYLTASDADMVESKALALLQRVFTEARDFLDLFLFQSAIPPDAARRLHAKLSTLSASGEQTADRLERLRRTLDVHARSVDRIIEAQVDPAAAANLRRAGGGATICDSVLRVLARLLTETDR